LKASSQVSFGIKASYLNPELPREIVGKSFSFAIRSFKFVSLRDHLQDCTEKDLKGISRIISLPCFSSDQSDSAIEISCFVYSVPVCMQALAIA
jgi:hypothetical protein